MDNQYKIALEMITAHYGERTTERSKVPLINHIYEGVALLDDMGASAHEKAAYCLHPLFQNDEDLAQNYYLACAFSGTVMMLVMEYRKHANSFLCRPETDHYTIENITPTPLQGVSRMVLADKIQNQKDFYKHHKNHPRAKQLKAYFETWITFLTTQPECDEDK